MRAFLEELRDRWNDPYYRADHPELAAILIAIATGLIGLIFAAAQIILERRYRIPKTGEV